jgi:RND family efflux transporter MFP subunit
MPNAEFKRSSFRPGAKLLIALILLAGVVTWGIWHRLHQQSELRREALDLSVLSVQVVQAAPVGDNEPLTLPGNLQAWIDTPVYARTNGYVKRWLVDIGTSVKAGQLLAEIDTPEVDQQVSQAQADLKTAKANADLAQLTAERWKALLPTNTVSRQDVDNKVGDAEAKQAALASAQANLKRLHELQGFKRITAPFAGVVTARNLDLGDLVESGTGSGKARELFHLSAIDRLRIFVQVPEGLAEAVKEGMTADLRVREHAAQVFSANVVGTAKAIDPVSHTLLVQLQADNARHVLLPGGYVEVGFKLPPTPGALRLSANALLFGAKGMQVGIVGADNKVTLQPVLIGRDFGKEVEILAGLTAEQKVILNPPDSLVTGQLVKAEAPQAQAKPAEAKPADKVPAK